MLRYFAIGIASFGGVQLLGIAARCHPEIRLGVLLLIAIAMVVGLIVGTANTIGLYQQQESWDSELVMVGFAPIVVFVVLALVALLSGVYAGEGCNV